PREFNSREAPRDGSCRNGLSAVYGSFLKSRNSQTARSKRDQREAAFMPTVVVLVLLALTVIFIGIIIARPEITAARGGKVLAFLACFIFPVFGGLLGLENHIERSKQTSFCLSCHVMGDYGRSLLVDDSSYIPAAHYQNNRVPRDEACYPCHTDYTLYSGAI